MNTCKKTNHYYYFLFIQRYRTSYLESTATPTFLTYFCKRTTFSFISQFFGFSGIFSYFFGDFFKSHRYAATYPRYATYRPLRSGLAAGRYARRYRYFHPWSWVSHVTYAKFTYANFTYANPIFISHV